MPTSPEAVVQFVGCLGERTTTSWLLAKAEPINHASGNRTIQMSFNPRLVIPKQLAVGSKVFAVGTLSTQLHAGRMEYRMNVVSIRWLQASCN